MSTSNPYLEYCNTTPAPADAPAATTGELDLKSMFAPQHCVTFGPFSLCCDVDPAGGALGITAKFFGFVFFQQKLTVDHGSVTVTCNRMGFSLTLTLTPDMANHRVAFQVQICPPVGSECFKAQGTVPPQFSAA